MFRNRWKSFIKNWRTRKASTAVPPPFTARTHVVLMTTSTPTSRTMVDPVLDAEDILNGQRIMNEIGEYYANLRKDPQREAQFSKQDDEWLLADFGEEYL